MPFNTVKLEWLLTSSSNMLMCMQFISQDAHPTIGKIMLDCSLQTTKKVLYDQYKTAAILAQIRVVAYRTFRRIWQEALPFIVTMRPVTDLCWVC